MIPGDKSSLRRLSAGEEEILTPEIISEAEKYLK